ncbi:Hypothetical protein D9617_47g010670 [Elsinoe fawcettii]|nr:Hypothetical protein D9617_47g010670 [Elsinoe fawcettii]
MRSAILNILTLGLVVDAVASSRLDARQSNGCTAKSRQIVTLNANVDEPVVFCLWWRGNKKNKSPFATLATADVNNACKCLLTKPSLGLDNTLPDVVPSNPQIKDIGTLQNSIVQVLPFCKFWNSQVSRDATPFTKLSPSTLYRLCTAIIKKPSLITPGKPKSSSKTSSSRTSSRTSSRSTIKTAAITTGISTSSHETTTTLSAVDSSSPISTATQMPTTTSTTTTTLSATTTTTLPTTTSTTSASPTPTPSQLIANPLLLGSGSQYYSTGDLSLPSWDPYLSLSHVNYTAANSTTPIHGLAIIANRTSTGAYGIDAAIFQNINITQAPGWYTILTAYDGYCNCTEGCSATVAGPGRQGGYIARWPANKPSDQLTGIPTISRGLYYFDQPSQDERLRVVFQSDFTAATDTSGEYKTYGMMVVLNVTMWGPFEDRGVANTFVPLPLSVSVNGTVS